MGSKENKLGRRLPFLGSDLLGMVSFFVKWYLAFTQKNVRVVI